MEEAKGSDQNRNKKEQTDKRSLNGNAPVLCQNMFPCQQEFSLPSKTWEGSSKISK